MEKKILLLIVGVLIYSFLIGQNKTKVEFQIAAGVETGLISPRITENLIISNPNTFGMQLNFQVIFNKIGFMLSYEKSSRIYQSSVINNVGEEVFFDEKIAANRFMVNFVGRITAIPDKMNIDLRFGLGALLNTERKESNSSVLTAVFFPMSVFIPKSLMCFDLGVKTYYVISPRVSCFIDASLTFSPYSYTVEKNFILFSYTDFQTSRIPILGLQAGISIGIGKM